MNKPPVPLDVPLTNTIYSVVWPETEALMRYAFRHCGEALLDLHRHPHTKRQDQMDASFFEAYIAFAGSQVKHLNVFSERYPTQGSSEAIREIIREAGWSRQAIVVFEGEYEGYSACARTQGSWIVEVPRERWRETLEVWRKEGVPWGNSHNGAQWWISEPSAIDGTAWVDFKDWLAATAEFADLGLNIWVDLCYVGRAPSAPVFNDGVPDHVAGVVFSLSKVMGAYYRRIGGALCRRPIQGLWANRWFKNLDSLWLGEFWLTHSRSLGTPGQRVVENARSAAEEARRYREDQALALRLLNAAVRSRYPSLLEEVEFVGTDVPMMVRVNSLVDVEKMSSVAQQLWLSGKRNPHISRLCISPILEEVINHDVA